MATNSKKKGNRAERDVAKWWELWTGFEFGRVPASGALRWKKTDNITSDVICTDDKHSRRFPFSIEVKNYKDINFSHLLLNLKSCKIHDFWKQANDDANRGNKIPILMMRYNGMPKSEYFFIVSEEVSNILNIPKEENLMIVRSKGIVIHIYMSTSVMATNYSDIYKYCKKLLKNK